MTLYEKLTLIIGAAAAAGTVGAVLWVLFKETILARWRRPIFKSDFKMETPFVMSYFGDVFGTQQSERN